MIAALKRLWQRLRGPKPTAPRAAPWWPTDRGLSAVRAPYVAQFGLGYRAEVPPRVLTAAICLALYFER